MSSKMDLEHEKPEVVDEQQPTVKKVRLAVEAVSVLDKKEGDAAETQDAAGSNDEDTSAENSPKADDDDDNDDSAPDAVGSADEQQSVTATVAPAIASDQTETAVGESAAVAAPNTKGSAFGGFAAFSGTSGFSAFAASSSSSGGFGAFASSGSGGFASFQSADATSFSSFASAAASSSATDTTASGGFGTTASASESVEFGSSEVKKAESTFVPALTDAEIANGEEGEQILIEKRAKLFKLADADYAEVGIGPLRVLKAASSESATAKSSVRIVMRRESYARGPGTKLLLNARLNACLACIEKTEKAMLLTVVESVSDAVDGSADGSVSGGDAGESESSEAVATTQQQLGGSGESAAAAAAAPKILPSTYLVRFGSSDDFQSVLARIRPWLPSTAASS